MALRRTHRKSRHGCLECKRRRVKCDENRPSCSHCSKRHAECEYESSSSIIWANDDSSSRPQSSKSSPEGLKQPDSSLLTDGSLGFLGRLGDAGTMASPVSLNFSNLELMMQWCNSTYKSLSRSERTDHVWRCLVPEEALSHTLLMHGIMSLSALHLACTKDVSRRSAYVSTAVAHQSHSLALFREHLGDINASNAKAMFSFSSIIVVYAFGFPHTSDWKEPSSYIHDLIQALVLSRGVQQVLSTAATSMRNSNFSPLFEIENPQPYLPDDVKSALEQLREANNICGARDVSHDTALYEDTIEKLSEMMSAMHGGLSSMTVACRWAIRLKPQFMDSLREDKSFALIILVHFCVALHYLRDSWHIEEWGSRVSKAIWLMLDDEWRPLIQWPMAKIHGQGSTLDVDIP